MNTVRSTAVRDENSAVTTDRRGAAIVGILFILATVSAILGLIFYQPILSSPDYLVAGAANANQVLLGALMELVLVCTAIGTAIGLFPVLRPYGERIALSHLCFRFLEASVISVGVVAVLSLLSLSQEYAAAGSPDAAAYRVSGSLLHATYKWTSALGPLLFLGINTFMYSSLLYKSKLVPRPLSITGLTGAVLVFGYGLLVISGVTAQATPPFIFLALPIAAYEMILAGWLIVKGFAPAAAVKSSTKAGVSELLRAA